MYSYKKIADTLYESILPGLYPPASFDLKGNIELSLDNMRDFIVKRYDYQYISDSFLQEITDLAQRDLLARRLVYSNLSQLIPFLENNLIDIEIPIPDSIQNNKYYTLISLKYSKKDFNYIIQYKFEEKRG